jgi:adenylate cyclase
VRVSGPPGALPAPGPEERRVLARIGALPGIRLACQLRPTGPVTVVPLLEAARPPRALLRLADARALGEEREVAIAFADLRDFTRLSENRLPFDVVHLLNDYFRSMGQAVEAAGGRVDKFIGDGVMALFGSGEPAGTLAERCRAGLEAARLMALALRDLNRLVGDEFGAPLRIGIGLHVGPVILGEMGHGRAMGLTAIGDAVNTASRLEAACKEFGCQLVVSEAVLLAAGADGIGEARTLQVRGRAAPLPVRAVADAAALPGFGRR